MRMDELDEKEKGTDVTETKDVTTGIDKALKAKLIELGLNEEQVNKLEKEGVKVEADLRDLTAAEIKEITECGIVISKKIKAAVIPVVVEKTVATETTQPSFDILPQVPDDNSFVEMLKVGGVPKVGVTELISAIKGTLADSTGLFKLPKIIIDSMEKFAESQDEPVGTDYYTLQKMVTRHSYAEIFAALDLDSASVTLEKKKKLLDRLAKLLWPALSGYHQQVVGWVQAWQQGAANPAAMMMAMTSVMSGSGAMPAGMLQAPDTSVLKDAAESVINEINKVFSGTGLVIARAIALDASRIKEVLDNPTLPIQVGAASREQMLKSFNVNVSADYVRLERNITRYALAILEFPKVTAGQSELAYLTALFQLGTAIPWDKLGSSAADKEVRPAAGNSFRGI